MWRRQLGRCRARHLDGQLAAGAPVEPETLLGARAAELCGLPSRWRLADDWGRLLADAEARVDAPGRRGPWRVRPLAERMAAARHEIDRLLAALYSFDAVNPQGVAMARLLLRDGTGPLYDPRAGRPLQDAIEDCLSALERRPSTRRGSRWPSHR